MEININDSVEVTLTGFGAQIWNKYHEGMSSIFCPDVVKEGEVLREQLWRLFQVFGEHIGLGRLSPFEECVITLVKR